MSREKYSSFAFLSTRLVLQALQALGKSKQIIRVKITATDVEFSSEDEGKVSDVGDDTAMHMYAHIALLGVSPVVNLIDRWQAPATEFCTTAATLREAVEDLEWPNSHVRMTVKANPFQVNLTSRGNVGELDVTIPHHLLRNTRTHDNSVSSCYIYKFVKAALSGVPGIKAEYNSQILMDKNGLLKVVHVVPGIRGGMEEMGAGNHASDIILTFIVQPKFIDELQEEMWREGDEGTQ